MGGQVPPQRVNKEGPEHLVAAEEYLVGQPADRRVREQQEQAHDTPQLEGRTPSRNTFTAIQDIISSHIEDWENRQGNDQFDGLRPASPQQSEPAGDASPQATIQLGPDIETPEGNLVSTPPRSPLQTIPFEQPALESGTHAESPSPTLRPDDPVSAPAPLQRQPVISNKVCINMKIKRQGDWRDMQPLMVDPSNPSDVERMMQRYIRQGIRPLNTRLGMLSAQHGFASITGDETNMILFLPDGELVLEGETIDSATRFHAEAVIQSAAGRKRAAEEDISRPYHPRKMRQWD
jgi:hypothetical protein